MKKHKSVKRKLLISLTNVTVTIIAEIKIEGNTIDKGVFISKGKFKSHS